ncbi:MAG: glycosyltransferase [Cyclobacteriaceae bacterium]|nr:glycosyltransferase [Cyclobacteriaceae bacterium]
MDPLFRLNLHVYPTTFLNESRILRESAALIDQGLVGQVLLIGLWSEGLPEEEQIRPGVKLRRINTSFSKRNSRWSNLLVFVVFYFRILQLQRRLRADIINVHSLTMLPVGTIAKWLFGVKLVYDAHELETETHASQGLRKKLSKYLERLLISQVDYMIVVSKSIEEWYRSVYHLQNIATIRNIPASRTLESPVDFRSMFGIEEDAIVFIYVGLISGGRGIPNLVSTFQHQSTHKHHLILIGYGNMFEEISRQESSNIHLMAAVSPSEVLSYVAGADIGLSMIENSCLSYYYSLPNKVFEYMTAGIPFICSNFPEVSREFNSSDLCWLISENELLSTIEGISQAEIQRKKSNILRLRNQWSWQHEQTLLIPVYQNLKSTKPE